MSGTIICPNCNGNGYVGNSKKEDQQDDCITCKNQRLLLGRCNQLDHLSKTKWFYGHEKK
jgi:hypothetical protein